LRGGGWTGGSDRSVGEATRPEDRQGQRCGQDQLAGSCVHGGRIAPDPPPTLRRSWELSGGSLPPASDASTVGPLVGLGAVVPGGGGIVGDPYGDRPRRRVGRGGGRLAGVVEAGEVVAQAQIAAFDLESLEECFDAATVRR